VVDIVGTRVLSSLREKDDPLPVGRGSVPAVCQIEGLPGHDDITEALALRECGGRLAFLAGFAGPYGCRSPVQCGH